MAAKGGGGSGCCAKLQQYATLAGSKNPKELTSKGCGKQVADCWDSKKEYHDLGVKAICDASVFPACKEKGKPHMALTEENVDKYVRKTAHELAKKKCKNTRLPENDDSVETIRCDLEKLLIETDLKVAATKISKTGGVDKMTDASKYTGAHKQRFDESGKGKGAEGRVDKVDHTGYVGQYKGQGTYGTKK